VTEEFRDGIPDSLIIELRGQVFRHEIKLFVAEGGGGIGQGGFDGLVADRQ